jgi:hypothetical protein
MFTHLTRIEDDPGAMAGGQEKVLGVQAVAEVLVER